VAEQHRQQIEEKLNHITLNEQGNGEKLWDRCITIINSVPETVFCIMEPANKGTWYDAERQAATADNNKAYRR
jgi:hypothetical protein